MAGSFDRIGQPALVFSTVAVSGSWLDLVPAIKIARESSDIFIINSLNFLLTKIAVFFDKYSIAVSVVSIFSFLIHLSPR